MTDVASSSTAIPTRASRAVIASRSPSEVDVQVAYDTLAQHCIRVFAGGGNLPPSLIAFAIGDQEGDVQMLGRVEDVMDSLLAEGRNGPVTAEFYRQALGNEEFRQKVAAAGERPADLIGFSAEVWFAQGEAAEREGLLIVMHTADRAFRGVLEIEDGEVRRAIYSPLQADISFGPAGDAPPKVRIEGMASSLPALAADHQLHDIHSTAGAQLH